MRKASSAAAICAFAAVVWGAGPATAQEPPKRGGTLTYGVAGDPHTMDCHAGNSFAVFHYLSPHYSTLLRPDKVKYPALEGDLAESWTISDDKLTYTFKLRPNVKFHDGSAFSSEDVKATYERILDPPEGVVSAWRSFYLDVASVEAPDPQTVVFKLKKPNAGMLESFASPYSCIYSAAQIRKDPRYPEKNVMGTGPFKFVEYVPGSRWIATRFDDYFRPGLPYLDGYRALSLSSTALVNALAGGQIDAEFRGITPADLERVKASRGDRMTFQETVGTGILLFAINTKQKPFDDVRVRKALTLAIDRWNGVVPLSKITSFKYVSGFQRPGAATALSDTELEALPGFGRDIKAARAEAKKLLAEAGVPNLKFELVNRGPANPYSSFGLYLIDQWRQIGVTVQNTVVDTAGWVQRRNSGNYQVIVDATADPSDDPNMTLVRYTSSDKQPANPTGFIDREIDTLFDAQSGEFDPAKRAAIAKQLESKIIEQAFANPGFRLQRVVSLATKVKGYRMIPSHISFGDLGEVWLSE